MGGRTVKGQIRPSTPPPKITEIPEGFVPLDPNDPSKGYTIEGSGGMWKFGFPDAVDPSATFDAPDPSPRSALALEQRLRSQRRRNRPKNIEGVFNLEGAS